MRTVFSIAQVRNVYVSLTLKNRWTFFIMASTGTSRIQFWFHLNRSPSANQQALYELIFKYVKLNSTRNNTGKVYSGE